MPTDMFYGASPELFRRAKELRDAMTPAEVRLWEALRGNQLRGFRFKPQHPIHTFVADFYCHAAKLIVELDGAVHDSIEQKAGDENRTLMLEEFGLTVVRFPNKKVFSDIEGVLSEIATYLPKTLPANASPPTP